MHQFIETSFVKISVFLVIALPQTVIFVNKKLICEPSQAILIAVAKIEPLEKLLDFFLMNLILKVYQIRAKIYIVTTFGCEGPRPSTQYWLLFKQANFVLARGQFCSECKA